MKKVFLTLFVFGVSILLSSTFSWAQCPEEPNDRGECDTLNLTCYDCEVDVGAGGPYTVQFPLLVTNDIVIAETDSIASFVVPLAWTRTNPSAYCSVSSFWNNTYLYPFPDVFTRHSVFHHITDPVTGDTLVRNRMMTMSEALSGIEWDTRILELDGTSHFWFTMFPTGSEDQRWWEADRVLLATMTFRVEDTMQVCIDSTFWPPASRLGFIRTDGVGYIPRHNMPRCFLIGPAQPPLCEVNPTNLDFGAVTIGDSLDTAFTISNIGGGTLSGTVTETCDYYSVVGDASYSLGSGESKEFTVRFKPLAAGVWDCTIETGNETCADVSCTATGEAAPACNVDPTSLDFGTVTVGDSLDTTFSISNTGGATLSGTVSETCEDYELVGDATYSLSSGQSKDFTVRFKPLSPGVKDCTVETGNETCADVSCTGTGESPPACSVDPTSLDFGTVTVGDSLDTTFSISNTGGGTLSGTVSETCDDYELVGDATYSLTSGQSKDFTLRFKPLSPGVKNCAIETGDDACADVSCTGSGEGAPPPAPSDCIASDDLCEMIQFCWTDNSDDETGFYIYRNSAKLDSVEAESTCYDDYSAITGVTYEYCVTAYNDYGESGQCCDSGTVDTEAVAVTVPNGGESWGVGTSQDITWTHSCLDTVKIEYSTNAGSDWTTEAEKVPAAQGSYSWIVPDAPSENCLVRICDVEDGIPCDESDAVFTITAEDFTMDVFPDTLRIMRTVPEDSFYTVVLTSIGGFDSPCTLTVSGLPTGASGAFDQPILVPTDTTRLVISADETVPEGYYDLVVTAMEIGGTRAIKHSKNVVLLVVLPTWGFDLDAQPDSQDVIVGDQVTYDIAMLPDIGFTAPCTLYLDSGLPPNASFDFTPQVIFPNETSILTVTTGGATPSGVYQLTVRGIANYKEQDYVDIILVVLVVQDFAVSVTPDTQYVTQGQSVGFDVQLDPINAFADPCTLRVSGLPDPPDSGVFDQPVLIPPDNTTLTVCTSAETDTGWYTLSITARSLPDGKPEPLEHSVNVYLRVTTASDADDWVDNSGTPKSFVLFQNQPNPFNPETRISYYLPRSCQVKLTIYNLLGQNVRTLFDGQQDAGTQTLIWDGRTDDGRQLSSGIYFYRLRAENFVETKKMTLMK